MRNHIVVLVVVGLALLSGCDSKAAATPRGFLVGDALLSSEELGPDYRPLGPTINPSQRLEAVRTGWEPIVGIGLIKQEIYRYESGGQSQLGFQYDSRPVSSSGWGGEKLAATRMGFEYETGLDGVLCQFHAQYDEYVVVLTFSDRRIDASLRDECTRLIRIVDAKMARLLGYK